MLYVIVLQPGVAQKDIFSMEAAHTAGKDSKGKYM